MVKDHLGNGYDSKAEMCDAYGISIGAFNYRVSTGLTLREALTKPVKHANVASRKCKDHLGNSFDTTEEMIKHYGLIRSSTFSYRLMLGWTLEEALTTPVGQNRKSVTDHLGNKFNTIKDMCEYHNLTTSAFQSRMKNGWSIEKALTTPVKQINRTDTNSMTSHLVNIDHLGNKFKSTSKMCEYYGIRIDFYKHRIKEGWTLQNALEIPIIKGIKVRLVYTGLDGEQYFKVSKPVNAYMNREQIKEYKENLSKQGR